MEALLEAIGERERVARENANERAGLIAATLVNLHRKRGQRPVQPRDFFRTPPKIVSPAEMEAALDAWMMSTNARG